MRLICTIFCLVTVLCSGAVESSPNLTFKDLNGVSQQPLSPTNRLASVLIFYWHDCPISNGYAPEINRIASTYTNFAFFIVQTDPELTPAVAKEHAQKFNLLPPILLDPAHILVKQTQVTVTPEVVIIGKNEKILYRGRIDNLYEALGKKRSAPTEHDLIQALDTLSVGKPLKKAETKAIGCLIE